MSGAVSAGTNASYDRTVISDGPIAAFLQADAAMEMAASSYAPGGAYGSDPPTGSVLKTDVADTDHKHAEGGQVKDPIAPVPFVDDKGNPVLGRGGKPMLRPAGLDPNFFVEQGLADRWSESQISSAPEGGDVAALLYEAYQLSHF